jgi:uncharacterized protein YqgV (UPF0045/DUF77 family)
MLVSAQVSIYPLRQERLSPAIAAVTDALTAAGLRPEIGPMSTLVSGPADAVFAALQDAFLRAGASGPVVLQVTLSNACPVRPSTDG